jgi:hypothetical protein
MTLCRRGAPFLLAALFLVPSMLRAQTPGPVVVSELMWPGSQASSADEWIELYNRSADTLSLQDWTITRGDGDDESTMVVLPDLTIAPGGVVLVANYDADNERSHLLRTPDVVDAAVSLPNSRLRLRLFDSQGTLMDDVDDGSGAPFAGDGSDPKASMVRLHLDMAGTAAAAWTTAVDAQGWDAGATERGTPGFVPGGATPVPPDATQVTARSWGRLKAAPR